MTALPPQQQLAAPGKWPLVGEKSPRPSAAPWTVTVCGCVAHARSWSLAELAALPQVERIIDIHCVTRWSQPQMPFGGVPLASLLERVQPNAAARYVSFIARSERDHSTSLALADALQLDVLVALTYRGLPLSSEHGGPVRTITPGRYFYKSLKWLERVELLAEDRLGYWEAQAGYHNRADPWREERFLAPTLTKQEAAEALASRDFRRRDLRGLAAAGHDLENLQAAGSLLRAADFRNARLRHARFDGANLSNALFENADLRGASFVQADLEGANFAGADLRGANFRGASLFGTSFCHEDGAHPALTDASTAVDSTAADVLTPVQAAWLGRSMGVD